MKLNKKYRPLSAFWLLLIVLMSANETFASDKAKTSTLNVVVSIKPLALMIEPLLADEAGSSARVQVLLPSHASPHSYAMKISDRQKMQKADLLVWVGEDLERFLQKPISQLPTGRSVAASQVSGITWPHPEEEAAAIEAHGHKHEGLHDPHLWLNPKNAIAVISAVTRRLQQLDPESAASYGSRAQKLIAEINEIDREILRKSLNYQEMSFLVSHDGFSHFVERYNMNQVAAIRSSADSKPGARHLYQLKKKAKSESVACVFVDAGGAAPWGNRLAKDLAINAVELDILAGDKTVKTYPQFMQNLLVSIEECFAKEQ